MSRKKTEDLRKVWPDRLARVQRSQARTDTTGMTRRLRDPDERAFLDARGWLGRFREAPLRDLRRR